MNPSERNKPQPGSQPNDPSSRPNYDHNTEEVAGLVYLAKAGNHQAMRQLYSIHRPMVQALIWRFTGGGAESEDLIQEAFLRAFRNIASFRAERASFRTWLYRIVSNACLDSMRRRKTRRIHMEEFYLLDSEQVSDRFDSPESLAETEQRRKLLRAALTRLPAKQRMALVLKHFNGLPIREIAVIMKCTEGTVKRHLYRAVRRLRREITSPGDTDEV